MKPSSLLAAFLLAESLAEYRVVDRAGELIGAVHTVAENEESGVLQVLGIMPTKDPRWVTLLSWDGCEVDIPALKVTVPLTRETILQIKPVEVTPELPPDMADPKLEAELDRFIGTSKDSALPPQMLADHALPAENNEQVVDATIEHVTEEGFAVSFRHPASNEWMMLDINLPATFQGRVFADAHLPLTLLLNAKSRNEIRGWRIPPEIQSDAAAKEAMSRLDMEGNTLPVPEDFDNPAQAESYQRALGQLFYRGEKPEPQA